MSGNRVEPEKAAAQNLPTASDWRAFWRTTLLLCGVLSLALGVCFFCAWNWARMGYWAKFVLLQGGIALCLTTAAFTGPDSRARFFCLLGGGLLVGPLLAVYGQAYQSGAQLWELFRVWALLLLPLAWTGQRTALFFLLWLTGSLGGILYLSLLSGGGFLYRPELAVFLAAQCLCAVLWEEAAHRLENSRLWLRERWFPRLLFFVALSCVTWALAVRIIEAIPFLNMGMGWLYIVLYLGLATWAWFRRRHGKQDIFMPACVVFSGCTLLVALLLRRGFLFDSGFDALLGWGLLVIALSAGAGMLLRFRLRTTAKEAARAMPWFVTFFQGIGGWVAALLLVAFGFFFVADSLRLDHMPLLVFGAVMLGAAALAGQGKNQVAAQFSLAAALCGTICIGIALYMLVYPHSGDAAYPAGIGFLAASLGPLAGYVVIRGFSYRLLAATGFFCCLFVGLLWGVFPHVFLTFPTFAPALRGACWVIFCLGLVAGKLRERNHSSWSPALHGLYLALQCYALCAAVLAATQSNVAIGDIIANSARIPRASILVFLLQSNAANLGASSGLALVCLAHVLTGASSEKAAEFDRAGRWRCLAAACLAVPVGWFLPGLSLGLLGLALCRLGNDRVMGGATALCLGCTVGCYYYSLNFSLLYYSLLLSASGLGMAATALLVFGHSSDAASQPPAAGAAARPSLRWRKAVIAATLALLLAGFNWSAWRQEILLAEGETIFLETTPVDPRALLLGDYMALNWRVDRDAAPAARLRGKQAGDAGNQVEENIMLVVRLDANRIASFSRLDEGGPLADGELRLRGKVRGRVVQTAASAFFFQGGQAEAYEAARYGELRVDGTGRSLLVALRDAQLRPIAPGRDDR